MMYRMALSNQCLNTFLNFAMYHRLYPVSAESVKSLEMSGTSTSLRRYAHFYHLSVSIDCACDWGEINLNSLLSSMDELEREYSYVGLSACTWSEFKRSIIHQILLGALRDMADRPNKSVSDAVTLNRCTNEIENLLKVYQHYYHDNETESLHISYGQLRELLLEGVMDKDELNCDRVRRLLDEHPLEAFKWKVIQFLRFVEDKALPIPRALVGEYEHPEIVQCYSNNKVTALAVTSADTKKKRKVNLLVAGKEGTFEEWAGSSEEKETFISQIHGVDRQRQNLTSRAVQTEELGSSQPFSTASVASDKAASRVELSSEHYAGESEEDSGSYEEIVQRNLKMAELRKEEQQTISSYVEGTYTDPFPPTTGTLSVLDEVTRSYYPQFMEMRRLDERGGESYWDFIQEGANKYKEQLLAQAEYEKENDLRVLAAQNMLDTSEEEEEEEEEDVEVGDYGELKEDCREGREEGG